MLEATVWEVGPFPIVSLCSGEHSSAGEENALEMRVSGASGLRGLLKSPGQGMLAELEMARKPVKWQENPEWE